MDLTRTAYGTWSGGRFMHFGEVLDEERYKKCIRVAYDSGIRTFVTADVYGQGKADAVIRRGFIGIPKGELLPRRDAWSRFYRRRTRGE